MFNVDVFALLIVKFKLMMESQPATLALAKV